MVTWRFSAVDIGLLLVTKSSFHANSSARLLLNSFKFYGHRNSGADFDFRKFYAAMIFTFQRKVIINFFFLKLFLSFGELAFKREQIMTETNELKDLTKRYIGLQTKVTNLALLELDLSLFFSLYNSTSWSFSYLLIHREKIMMLKRKNLNI